MDDGMGLMQSEGDLKVRTPLRFGVLGNGTVFCRWQVAALQELIARGHQLVLLIADDREKEEKSLLRRLRRKDPRTLLFSALENRLFRPPARNPLSMTEEFDGVPVINCRPERRGSSDYFHDEDLARIGEYRLDVLLRFGFGIIRGGILSAARYGVWSFHHDDEMRYRGGPAGFWEIYTGDPVSGAILQRLTPRLDGGIVLKKGYLKTQFHSWRENQEQLLMVSSVWPAMVADEIARDCSVAGDGKWIDGEVSRTEAPVYRIPGNRAMIRFLAILLRNRIRFYFREYFRAEIWNVGIIRRSIREVALEHGPLKAEDVEWVAPAGKSRYLADPFGYHDGTGLHILAEDYRYSMRRAEISEITTPSGSPHPVRVPPPRQGPPVHLSYPFVFQHDDNIYCLPEACRSNELTLYRRQPSTGELVPERILLRDTCAIDPTLTLFQDRWWLFFTTRQHSNTHLFIYHATALNSEFQPHRLNPVKVDIRSARPAGTPFLHAGILYRPAQDCSVTYGGRVAICRVIRLTPDDFAEEVVRFVEPPARSGFSLGLHTLSSAGDITLIDGKKYRFLFRHMVGRFRERTMRKEASRG